jgi:hypothetical protein
MAFLFILPATLVAQPDKDVRPSITENIEQLNRDVTLKPASFRSSMSLTADTIPTESGTNSIRQTYESAQQAQEGQNVLPDSSSTASISPN